MIQRDNYKENEHAKMVTFRIQVCIHAQKGVSEAPEHTSQHSKPWERPLDPPHSISIMGPTFCISSAPSSRRP